jgi:3-methyladenine DNA glycosylase/8-oxoguanine DNA glycosylase
MVMEVGLGLDGNWSADATLLERLEAQIAATEDLAVRKVFAAYLSEP